MNQLIALCPSMRRWKSRRKYSWCDAAGFATFQVGRAGRFPAYFEKEQVMSTNKDQVKGRVKEAEGKIKEVAGKLVGNEKLEQKGKTQKILGEAQAKFGDVKKDVKDAGKAA
jgi:uncharacterized protein YjbJ (UPF0337 family)